MYLHRGGETPRTGYELFIGKKDSTVPGGAGGRGGAVCVFIQYTDVSQRRRMCVWLAKKLHKCSRELKLQQMPDNEQFYRVRNTDRTGRNSRRFFLLLLKSAPVTGSVRGGVKCQLLEESRFK